MIKNFYSVEVYKHEFPYGKIESKYYYFNNKDLALKFINKYALNKFDIDLNSPIPIYINEDDGISMSYKEVEFCNELPKLKYDVKPDFLI